MRRAVLGPGVGNHRAVVVTRVVGIPGLPRDRIAAVERSVVGEARPVFVHLTPANDGWAIVNLISDAGDDFRPVCERQAGIAG